jgi:hypothetical protein
MMIDSSDNPSDEAVLTETISDVVPTDCVLPELLLITTDKLEVSDTDDIVSVETIVVSEVVSVIVISTVDKYVSVVVSVVEPKMQHLKKKIKTPTT